MQKQAAPQQRCPARMRNISSGATQILTSTLPCAQVWGSRRACAVPEVLPLGYSRPPERWCASGLQVLLPRGSASCCLGTVWMCLYHQ